ncbi:hypothetical protein B0H14DRAFT_3866926 [Mycena olivaceomarginata]|nr:hypothetical protein B0H14DRAFT_3866926 [Mycena olivaceomarginata]
MSDSDSDSNPADPRSSQFIPSSPFNDTDSDAGTAAPRPREAVTAEVEATEARRAEGGVLWNWFSSVDADRSGAITAPELGALPSFLCVILHTD